MTRPSAKTFGRQFIHSTQPFEMHANFPGHPSANNDLKPSSLEINFKTSKQAQFAMNVAPDAMAPERKCPNGKTDIWLTATQFAVRSSISPRRKSDTHSIRTLSIQF